jgi:hypothetical protein
MKKIRRPLVDINWRDFRTGEIVKEKYVLEQEKNIDKRIEEWIKQKVEESKVDWKIFVEWLGRVNI